MEGFLSHIYKIDLNSTLISPCVGKDFYHLFTGLSWISQQEISSRSYYMKMLQFSSWDWIFHTSLWWRHTELYYIISVAPQTNMKCHVGYWKAIYSSKKLKNIRDTLITLYRQILMSIVWSCLLAFLFVRLFPMIDFLAFPSLYLWYLYWYFLPDRIIL